MSGNLPVVILLISNSSSDPNLELGRLLLFTHGIDLAKDIARNCGVSTYVDWGDNTVKVTSQDPDLIASAVQRFNKLEEFYVPLSSIKSDANGRIALVCRSSICRPCCACRTTFKTNW